MKNFSKIPLAVSLACGIGACGLAALSFFVIIASSFGFNLPFTYFQYLNAPVLSVLLPVVAMLALLPFALRLAFEREKERAAGEVVEIGGRKVMVGEEGDEYHLKAA
jgi:hypothetical protein